MEIDNGGPAFPQSLVDTGGRGGIATSDEFDVGGMTLRDYFAAKAMPICLAGCDEFPDENWRIGVALDAYAMADAMLAARKGGVQWKC